MFAPKYFFVFIVYTKVLLNFCASSNSVYLFYNPSRTAPSVFFDLQLNTFCSFCNIHVCRLKKRNRIKHFSFYSRQILHNAEIVKLIMKIVFHDIVLFFVSSFLLIIFN